MRQSLAYLLQDSRLAPLKIKPTGARALGQRRHTTVVDIAATVEHHALHTGGFGALSKQLPHLIRLAHAAVRGQTLDRLGQRVSAFFASAILRASLALWLWGLLGGQRIERVGAEVGKVFIARRRGDNRAALYVVNHLGVNLIGTAENRKPWARGRSGESLAHPHMPDHACLIRILLLDHKTSPRVFSADLALLCAPCLLPFTGYFFLLPALPAFIRTTSPV